MLAAFAVALALFAQPDRPEVSREEFLRRVQALQGEITSCSFVFEGESHHIAGRVPADLDVKDFDSSFQGSYLYRSDGAVCLEYYTHFASGRPYVHSATAFNKGFWEDITHTPDGRKVPGFRRRQGTPKALVRYPHSPENFVYVSYFRALSEKRNFGYQFHGWEFVEEHACLRVEIDKYGGQIPGAPVERLWVDMARGANPLRMETYVKGEKTLSVDGIRLKEFRLARAGRIWFPVGGVTRFYKLKDRVPDEPWAEETAHLVDGSLRLNEARPEAAFSVRAIIDGEATSKIRPQGPPPRRTDRLGVQKRLEERAAEAKRQLRELSGSAGVRKDPDWTNLVRAGLAGLGLLLLTGALICWRRGKG